MRFVDLFSGIGGMSLGLERAGMRCVGHVERDKFCRRVLRKHWPDVPLMGDIREVNGDEFGPVDLVAGGPPCQPVSVAGKRRGEADDRWLWGEALRLVGTIRPAWCLFENPPGIVNLGLDGILAALEGDGYSCRVFEIPACAVNAPHIRQRVWILAHSHSGGREAEQGLGQALKRQETNPFNGGYPLERGQAWAMSGGSSWDDAEWLACWDGKLRRVGRGVRLLAPRLPGDVARLRGLGNAVSPPVVEAIGRAIVEANR